MSTQEVVSGVGIVDLVARAIDGSDIEAEVWVEAKVWAAESGDQLSRNQRHLAGQQDGTPRSLVVIGPRPVGSADGAPWVSWQSIRDEVARSADVNPLWREFSTFLEERNVADVSNDPVTAREAASMVDAHNLFRKATKVLTDVNALGQQQWPAWGWGGKDQITQSILGQFQRHSRFTIFTGSKPIYLVLGYTDLSGTGEAHLTVWVESDPRKADLRMDILKAAENGGLDVTWVRRLDSWQALGRTQRAAMVDGPEASIAWFAARLSELASAGIEPGPKTSAS